MIDPKATADVTADPSTLDESSYSELPSSIEPNTVEANEITISSSITTATTTTATTMITTSIPESVSESASESAPALELTPLLESTPVLKSSLILEPALAPESEPVAYSTTAPTISPIPGADSTPTPKRQPTTNTKRTKNPSSTYPSTNDLETANDEIASLLLSNKITNKESSKLQNVLRENTALKDKITKLKLLLTRSAKASKETKKDLEGQRRLIDMAQQEIQRLNVRLETLASRPTHMDLLADFETNFDKAILSMGPNATSENGGSGGGNTSQSGGETTTSQANDIGVVSTMDGDDVVSSMLLTELSQAKERSERLETMNDALSERAVRLEQINEQSIQEKESINLKMSNLQLELRMAKMETDNASRAMREKAASLGEMQMEIDLVTRSAMDANVRAAEGMQVAKNIKTDKAHVQELEAKVTALQEWAVASASAKQIIVEQNRDLQERLRKLISSRQDDTATGGGGDGSEKEVSLKSQSSSSSNMLENEMKDSDKWNSSIERRLWSKASSLVVGAGMSQWHVIELGECHLQDNETVLLRWQFDITPSDTNTVFTILKGRCADKRDIRDADAVLKQRLVQGGAGGEVQGAFAVKNACTLVWSNANAWIRPRAIKYTVDAFAVM